MRDSERMRFRLGAYCRDISSDRRYEIVRLVERETGIRVPLTGGYPDLDRFFQKNSLRDVLDAITYVYRVFVANRYMQEAEGWKRYAGRVLAEEHTTYALTDDCHVTFAVDEIYAATRTATLAGLSYPHWSEARTELERAFEALDRDPPDTNGAIRAIAASVESASKVILGSGVSRVGTAEIERNLAPVVRTIFEHDNAAKNASLQILKAYADWTNATHQYRHGQGAAHEGHAPLELAVNLVSTGSSILRWLVSVLTPANQSGQVSGSQAG